MTTDDEKRAFLARAREQNKAALDRLGEGPPDVKPAYTRGQAVGAGAATWDRTAELQEAIDSADSEPFVTLEDAAIDELMRLWGDLHEQMRYARNGCWSVGCEGVARRIAVLTRALGRATRWQQVQIELLETGIYQRMHDLMGVAYDPPDMAVVAEMRAEREASLAEARQRPFERCSICQKNARDWDAAAANGDQKRRNLLPPPAWCSMCAELNGRVGGPLGAMLALGKGRGR